MSDGLSLAHNCIYSMNSIDINRLSNVRRVNAEKITAACEICREDGADKNSNHFVVFDNGAYGCIVNKNHGQMMLSRFGSELQVTASHVHHNSPKIEIDEEFPAEMLDNLLPIHDYWLNRGVSLETCKFFKIGLAQRGKMKHRSVIPIFHPHNGGIIGFTGRWALNSDPPFGMKYKHIGQRNKFVWPAFPNSENIRRKESIILVESPACVLKLWTMGVKNILCLFGTGVSSSVISHLISHNPIKVFIATNNEPFNRFVGNEAAFKIKRKLDFFFDGPNVIVKLPPRKDFGEMDENEIHQYASSLA